MNAPSTALLAGMLAYGFVASVAAEPTLNDVFKDDFLVGAALNNWQVAGTSTTDVQIIETHFNTVTLENSLKWGNIHPRSGHYVFEQATGLWSMAESTA